MTGAELRIPFILEINNKNNLKKDESSEVLSELKSVKILIHDIVKPITPENSKKPKEYHLKEPITYPIDTKSVNLSKRGNGTFWLTFDVFPAVQRWISQMSSSETSKKRSNNHGLLLEIIGLTNKGQFVSQEELLDKHSHNLRVRRDLLDESSSSSSVKYQESSSSSPTSSDDEKGTEVGAVSAVIQQNE